MKDPTKTNVLVACEESQRVCMAFRERGFNAFSCDIQECSGGHPEYHIHGDAVKALDAGEITTMDGTTHHIPKWTLLIAHPPCTYLSNVATRAFSLRCTPRKSCASMGRQGESGDILHAFRSCRYPA